VYASIQLSAARVFNKLDLTWLHFQMGCDILWWVCLFVCLLT